MVTSEKLQVSCLGLACNYGILMGHFRSFPCLICSKFFVAFKMLQKICYNGMPGVQGESGLYQKPIAGGLFSLIKVIGTKYRIVKSCRFLVCGPEFPAPDRCGPSRSPGKPGTAAFPYIKTHLVQKNLFHYSPFTYSPIHPFTHSPFTIHH